MGCCCKKKYNGNYDYDSDEDGVRVKQKRPCWCITLKWTSIVLFCIILVLFIALFIILPIVFMNSITLQRYVMFPNFDQPDNPQYTNYELYGARGVRNTYVTVDDILDPSSKVSLGIWQVVPEDKIEETEANPNFDYDMEMKNSNKPIIIYFHGNSGTRIYPLPTYNIMRKYFHVIAFDYRSYGDSTKATLTERAVVNDAIQLYKWVQARTKQNNIYIWGHSLGTALSTHTVKELKKEKIFPKGLILEAPFTTMREEIQFHPLGKIFTWLPWFEATILDPLEENNFHFKTTTNIKDVECPIMILHAEDDSVIPYELGKKLYDVALKNGKIASYHQIPANFRCNHLEINRHPDLPKYIEDFLAGKQTETS